MRAFTLLSAAVLLFSASTTHAANVFGTSGNGLIRLDTSSGTSTALGAFQFQHPSEHGMYDLARTSDGKLWGISTAQFGSVSTVIPSWVYEIDETNAITTATWNLGSINPGGAAIDPSDDSLWYLVLDSGPWGPFGPDLALLRLDLANGQVTSHGTLPNGVAFSFVDLVFDGAGTLHTVNYADMSLWTVDKSNASGPGTQKIGDLNGGIDKSLGFNVTFDASSGSTFLLEQAGKKWFSIDLLTGVASATGSPATGAPDIFGLSGSSCPGLKTSYGVGCAGNGGFVPKIALEGCPEVGGQVQLSYSNAFGGQPALLMFGLLQTQVPIGGGCDRLIDPVGIVTPIFALGGVGPGAGSASLPAVIPPGAAGVTITIQGANGDNQSVLGFVVTNGIEVTFP